jgi:hypothetical protein
VSSLTRGWVCRLKLLLVLASAVILRSETHGIHDRILLSQIPQFPNLEDQVPVFICPRNRVAQLKPQALGSLFVSCYDSQGCSGGIRSRLHTGIPTYNSKLLYDWRFTASQLVFAPTPSGLPPEMVFFQLNSCGHSPDVTSSLTRR